MDQMTIAPKLTTYAPASEPSINGKSTKGKVAFLVQGDGSGTLADRAEIPVPSFDPNAPPEISSYNIRIYGDPSIGNGSIIKDRVSIGAAVIRTRYRRSNPYYDTPIPVDLKSFKSGAKIGQGAMIHSQVTIRSEVEVGDCVTIHEQATLDQGVHLGNNVNIGRNTKIDPYATVGKRTRIGSFTRIDSYTTIGDNVIIEERGKIGFSGWRGGYDCRSIEEIRKEKVVIKDGAHLGNEVIVGSGAIIKKAQVESEVTIGRRAYIGSGVTIDSGLEIPPGLFIPDGTHVTKQLLQELNPFEEVAQKEYKNPDPSPELAVLEKAGYSLQKASRNLREVLGYSTESYRKRILEKLARHREEQKGYVTA